MRLDRHGPVARSVISILLAAITIAVFLPVVDNAFVNWGDEQEIVGNEHFRSFSASNLAWMFTAIQMGHYQPLTWLSFALDHALFGLSARAYHGTVLLLHAACAVVAWLLIRRLVDLAGAARGAAPLTASLASAAGSLLFALHPLRVESVAWASERRGPLSALFFLVSLHVWLSYADAPTEDERRRRRCYGIALGCFAASLLAKELALTLPAVLLVLDVVPLRRLPVDPRRWTVSTLGRLLAEKAPFFGLSLAWAWISVQSSLQSSVARSLAEYTIPQRLAQMFYGLAFYPWKTLAPVGLSNLYALPVRLDPLDTRYVAAAVAVLAITIALALRARRRPAAFAVWTAYVVLVLPVTGLAQTGNQIAADRYTYLPAVGLGALAAGALVAGWRRAGRAGRALLVVAASLVLVSLAVATRRQIAVWRTSETLWAHAIAVDPASAVAQNNYGVVLGRSGRLEGASEHLARATELDPGYVEARLNLGSVLAMAGRLDEAVEQFEAALELDPGNRRARESLERARGVRR